MAAKDTAPVSATMRRMSGTARARPDTSATRSTRVSGQHLRGTRGARFASAISCTGCIWSTNENARTTASASWADARSPFSGSEYKMTSWTW